MCSKGHDNPRKMNGGALVGCALDVGALDGGALVRGKHDLLLDMGLHEMKWGDKTCQRRKGGKKNDTFC